jgi:hypothetical protein
MAKHTFSTKRYGHHDMDQTTQERVGRVHGLYCKPKHAEGRYDHGAEQAAAMDYAVAQANDRQSKFYENFDRTEDARGD